MIKLLGICGSPRKGATEYVLADALKTAETVEGVTTKLILLRNRKLNNCLHCDKCIREKSKFCVIHTENNQDLYEEFFTADGFLIASPVYSMNITAQLTSFFNLLRPTWNILMDDPAFFWSKVGAGISVGGTRHGGQELTLNAIHGFYHTYGIHVIGGAHTYNGGTVWSRDQKAEGAKKDHEGMMTARAIAQRLALAAYQMRYGQAAFNELKKETEFISF